MTIEEKDEALSAIGDHAENGVFYIVMATDDCAVLDGIFTVEELKKIINIMEQPKAT